MQDPETKEIFGPYQAFYIQSMLYNAQSALRSITQVDSIIKVVYENSPEDPVGAMPVPTMLYELQNFIINAASLSRYFWPVIKAHHWRGNHLRRVFEVTEESALYDRDLRNAIEHFDERLDKYLENGISGHILPALVGYSDEANEVPMHVFRAYYLDTGEFQLLGKRYAIPPIVEEVARVFERLNKFDAEGGVFRGT